MARNTPNAKRVALPKNLRAITAMKNWVKKKLHGQDITCTLSLRVLRGALKLQEGYLLQLKKKGAQRKKDVKPPNIRETLCSLLGISKPTYGKIIASYINHKTIYSSGANERRGGNRSAKVTRIPSTKEMVLCIRTFVRDRQLRRERTTARQVLDFLIEKNYLVIPTEMDRLPCKKSYNSAYRNVRRFVATLGYQRGRRTGNMVPSPEQTLKVHNYLKAFQANRNSSDEERLREVYMDESYIHEHYHRNDDSLWDPNDDQDV